MDIKSYSVRIEEVEAEGLRADKYVADYLSLFNRNQIKRREVEFYLDGKKIKPSKPVHTDALLEIRYRPDPEDEGKDRRIEGEKIPLDILYEDENVLVLNKEQGMVVHPAEGNMSGTIVNGLLYRYPFLRSEFPEKKLRPGIVHRLDKDTSGVLIVAKTRETYHHLSRQFAERRVRKTYLAEAKGSPSPREGSISYPIARDRVHRKKFTWKRTDGKEAYTEYKVLRSLGTTSLVELRPKTGRTHQLRVHMAAEGHPIVGDPIYGRPLKGREAETLMLHAYLLKIELPDKGRGGLQESSNFPPPDISPNSRTFTKPHTFRAPLPERFRRRLYSVSKSNWPFIE